MQVFTALGEERFERRVARVAAPAVLIPEALIQQLEDLSLRRGNRDEIDQLALALRAQARLEGWLRDRAACRLANRELRNRLDIDVERIAEEPARRAVRARAPGLDGHERMQRVQADHIRAGAGGEVDQRGEVGEVAAAPVAARAQRGKLHGHAPNAAVAGKRCRAIATRGRDDQRHRRAFALALAIELEAVVARWKRDACSREVESIARELLGAHALLCHHG